jgi:hypothetical protein
VAGESLCDGESESASLLPAHGWNVGAVEPAEESVSLVGGESHSGIGDACDRFSALPSHAQFYSSPGGRVLDRVVEQVAERGRYVVEGCRRPDFSVQGAHQRDTFRLRHRFQALGRLARDGGEIDGTGVASDEGVLVAAFDGKHGWFWRNRTNETLTITLRTSGDVKEVVGP